MKIIDCKKKQEEMLVEVKEKTDKIFADTGKRPKLVVVQVEGDDASNVYIRNKKKTSEECGIEFEHRKLKPDTSEHDLKAILEQLNQDETVTGVMLQLPLSDSLMRCKQDILNTIDWKKDVDGLTSTSVGKLWTNQNGIHPATAEGIMTILDDDLSGKNVLVINRSDLIGKPLVKLLEQRNATVTLAHSKTNKEELVLAMRRSDIVITATGQPKWIEKHIFVNKHISTIIDCGMCRDKNNKLCGDVDTDSFTSLDVNVTVTPGGVGKLTVGQLMMNVIKAYKLQED